ncbi:40S ribosomal protein S15 [Biomphalaria glabrata]|nr:putative 40S ribosomal protein S15 [Biomphalaria glabrata]
MSMDQLADLFNVGQRRRLNRDLKRRPLEEFEESQEGSCTFRSEVSKTHLRDMIIFQEMLGSIVAVYKGKTFNQVEIRPEMVGHYFGEFSITYKPVKHGRPGIGATPSSRFIPLKYTMGYNF